jgi:single-strand DNA-binding protein
MASFNKVILIGNMVADPELKQTPSGTSVCRFRLAVQRKFTKEEGQQTADFLDVVAWRQTAEFVSKYFKKGNPILVCGQLQSRTWTDKDGVKRSSVEIIADEVSFVGSKTDSNDTYMPSAYAPRPEEEGKINGLPF